jgi:hypothetical protein
VPGGIDPSKKGMLSVLLGQDVDGMLRPVAVAATAASYAPVEEHPGRGGDRSSPKNLTVASRSATSLERISKGEES